MARQVPFWYTPRPQQKEAWARRMSRKYDYYFKCCHRQFGKDTDDIQYALNDAWLNPGIQSAYVGLDNKWIKRTIWNKYLDKRRHWDSYPEDKILVKETEQQIYMLNNPDDLAPSMLQFIGFKESESLIGSSYDRFFISELSLYKRKAFDFITPIWENKLANGEDLLVNMNFTPRGISNLAADMLRTYTGIDEPEFWPGEHITDFGKVFVDYLPANVTLKADGTRLYPDGELEKIRQRVIRADGNDNRFRQEFMLDFLAVNAGLVYPGVEVLKTEGRYCPFNLATQHPVYMAWDISSKGKESDWTSCLVFQYYNGTLFVYDYYEDNRKAVVECVQELSGRDYFHLMRAGALPWDSDRSGSKDSPLSECMKMFPGISWHKLDRTYEVDGINRVRSQLPNMVINSNKCEWVVECMESWEYRELTGGPDADDADWASKPKHNRYSHLMDALRYVCDMVAQVEYVRTTDGRPRPMPSHYREGEYGSEDEAEDWGNLPPYMRPSKTSPLRKKKPSQVYKQEDVKESPHPGWKHENGLWVPDGS